MRMCGRESAKSWVADREVEMARKKEPRVNRKKIDVVSLKDAGNDVAYWRAQSLDARLEHLEFLRWINYGNATRGRLKRVLEVVKRPKS